MIALNALFTYIVIPAMDTGYLSAAKYGKVPLTAVLGVWSIIAAMAIAVLMVTLLNLKRIADVRKSITEGTLGSLLPVCNTAAEVSYGAVIPGLAAFIAFRESLKSVVSDPLLSVALVVNMLAGLLAKVAVLRKALGADLSIVHVVDSRGLNVGEPSSVMMPGHHDDTVAEASTNITETAALVPHDKDVLTDGADDFLHQVAARLGLGPERCRAVENDSVRDAIIDTARQVGADLVVLGHGSRHLRSWFTASVAQGVLGRAPCDVLMIHLEA